DRDVSGAALIPVCPAHRRRTDSLQPRSFVDETSFDEKVVGIDVFILVRRVRNGGLDDFFNLVRRFRFVRELQCHQGLVDVHTANQIHREPRFLRRHPDEPAGRFAYHNQFAFGGGAAGAPAPPPVADGGAAPPPGGGPAGAAALSFAPTALGRLNIG